MEKLTYTATEAAQAANVSMPTMFSLLKRADFPSLRIGKKWLVPRADFEKWLSDQAKSKEE